MVLIFHIRVFKVNCYDDLRMIWNLLDKIIKLLLGYPIALKTVMNNTWKVFRSEMVVNGIKILLMFNIPSHLRNANKNYKEVPSHPVENGCH